jgi:c-di-AMP phosphodiesterase-like protein
VREYESVSGETFLERALALACIAILEKNIDALERPNSGVVIHIDQSVYVVTFDGEDQQLHLYDVTEDSDMTSLTQGTMVVLEGEPN